MKARRKKQPDSGLAIVWRGDFEMAELFRGYLVEHGIRAQVTNRAVSGWFSWIAARGGAGASELVVHARDEERAREMISRLAQEKGELQVEAR